MHRVRARYDQNEAHLNFIQKLASRPTAYPNQSANTPVHIRCADQTQCVHMRAFMCTAVFKRVQWRVLSVQTCAQRVFARVRLGSLVPRHLCTCAHHVLNVCTRVLLCAQICANRVQTMRRSCTHAASHLKTYALSGARTTPYTETFPKHTPNTGKYGVRMVCLMSAQEHVSVRVAVCRRVFGRVQTCTSGVSPRQRGHLRQRSGHLSVRRGSFDRHHPSNKALRSTKHLD